MIRFFLGFLFISFLTLILPSAQAAMTSVEFVKKLVEIYEAKEKVVTLADLERNPALKKMVGQIVAYIEEKKAKVGEGPGTYTVQLATGGPYVHYTIDLEGKMRGHFIDNSPTVESLAPGEYRLLALNKSRKLKALTKYEESVAQEIRGLERRGESGLRKLRTGGIEIEFNKSPDSNYAQVVSIKYSASPSTQTEREKLERANDLISKITELRLGRATGELSSKPTDLDSLYKDLQTTLEPKSFTLAEKAISEAIKRGLERFRRGAPGPAK